MQNGNHANGVVMLPPNTPLDAPLPNFDLAKATFFDLFLPSYYNLEVIEALTRKNGGSISLEVESVHIEYLENPKTGKGDWKPVVRFVGDGPALALNQTRARILVKATNSIEVSDWHKVGWLKLWAGVDSGRYQILIDVAQPPNQKQPTPPKSPPSVDEINEALYG